MRNLVDNLGGQLVELILADDARCLELFAWFKNPSDQPQLIDLEIPEKTRQVLRDRGTRG
ncbi:hypothetical protein E2562_023869 [Oryza meyeriana var. granulata]|uniref:Uncharacterized protein n=1 Tax=Oryza meyeriana var. granulata TaxID=110450 RepID=A0A6G1D673_9ORYZ|nr:hypothetical protein E2562_023869 [Oryza meyeriana var. granulata]